VAKADPENTRSVSPFQLPLAEAADVHMSKLMALAIDQWRVSADPRKHLNNLETSLRTIAKDLKLTDPKLQAQIVRNKLTQRIEGLRSSIARNWRYGRFVDQGSISPRDLTLGCATSLGTQTKGEN
jgi:hypothetical protein